jgi:hypothetical protein
VSVTVIEMRAHREIRACACVCLHEGDRCPWALTARQAREHQHQQDERDATAMADGTAAAPEETGRMVLSDASEFVRKLGESAAAGAVAAPGVSAAPANVDDEDGDDQGGAPKVVKRTHIRTRTTQN